MTTCPNCFGRCDVSKIQLEEIDMETEDFFFCKKCQGLFQFKEISKDDLECMWSEEFLSDLRKKIDVFCVEEEQ